MVRFAEIFPDRAIVHTLCGQLSWSHFRNLIYIEDPLAREFYTGMCRLERWSVRTLQAKIQGMLFERTALSKKPEELAKKELAALRDEDRMTPDLVFKNPYFLEFLGLSDTFSEKDLENSILRELELFILELGTDFSFVARQKRITVDAEDYYIDLLFYHRKLRRLVAIDLKLGKFKAADKGQMELYLRWLDKYDRQPGEEPPIGLILCAGSSVGHVELLELEASSIRVAEYLTELPPREVLEQKLKAAVDNCTGAARRTGIIPRTAHPGVPPTTPRAGTIVSGWREIGRSCSLICVPFACAHCTPIRFTSPPLFFMVARWDDDAHLACRDARRQRLLRPAPHTMLRIVFVAVDRADA